MRRPVGSKAQRKLRKSFRRHFRNLEMNVLPNKRRQIERAYLANKTPKERAMIRSIKARAVRERSGIKAEIRGALNETRKKFPFVKGIVLFGSFSRGAVKPRDIDALQFIDVNLLRRYEKQHPGSIIRGDDIDRILHRADITPQLTAWETFSKALKKRIGLHVAIIPPHHRGDFRYYISYDPKNIAPLVREILSKRLEFHEQPGGRFEPRKPGFKPQPWHFMGDQKVRKDFNKALNIIKSVQKIINIRDFHTRGLIDSIIEKRRFTQRKMSVAAVTNAIKPLFEENRKRVRRLHSSQPERYNQWFNLLHVDKTLDRYSTQIGERLQREPFKEDEILLNEVRKLGGQLSKARAAEQRVKLIAKISHLQTLWKEIISRFGFSV